MAGVGAARTNRKLAGNAPRKELAPRARSGKEIQNPAVNQLPIARLIGRYGNAAETIMLKRD